MHSMRDSDETKGLACKSQYFDEFCSQEAKNQKEPGGFVPFPPLAIVKGQKGIVVKAEMPGMKRDGIRIDIDNGLLTISGERMEEALNENQVLLINEQWHGTFSRSLQLPETVDPAKTKAEYDNGVLVVVIPNKKKLKPRKLAPHAQKHSSAGPNDGANG